MSDFIMQPNIWDPATQTVEVPAKIVNYIVGEKVYNKFNTYQQRFNVFRFLPIDSQNKIRIHTIGGNTPMWQKAQGCKRTPMGGMSMDNRTLDTCVVDLFAKWCPREMFDTCFSGLLRYSASGEENTETLNQLVGIVVANFTRNALKSALNLALLGNYFDLDQISLNENVGDELLKQFQTEHQACNGLLYKVKSKADQYPTLCCDVEWPEEMTSACKSKIDILGLFDALKCCAHPQLQEAIETGMMEDFNGGMVAPILVLSNNLVSSLWNKAVEVGEKQLQNGFANPKSFCAIEKVMGANGEIQYYIYGVPVVPLSVFCGYNEYLSGDYYFAALTVSNNMQVATNYGGQFGNSNLSGLRISRIMHDENGERGTYVAAGEGIIGADLANYNLFTMTDHFYPY